MILAEPRAQAIDVVVVTRACVTIREDGTHQQVRFVGKKKEAFDIAMEKETFFQSKHAIGRNPVKLPLVEMPSSFDPSIKEGPSRQHGTLQ